MEDSIFEGILFSYIILGIIIVMILLSDIFSGKITYHSLITFLYTLSMTYFVYKNARFKN